MLTKLKLQELMDTVHIVAHDGLQPLGNIMYHVLNFELYHYFHLLNPLDHISLKGFPFILIMFSQIKSDIEKC